MGRGEKKRKLLQKKGVISLDTSKPSAAPTASGGRRYTVSLALPGSIIANAKRLEDKTNLASQIGRALGVFCVDEVVIYNDGTVPTEEQGGISEPNAFLAHLLQFLETPQYLRTYMFPIHPDLRHAGLLKSMDLTHHLSATDRLPYREGVTLPAKRDVQGTLVDIGIGTVLLPGEKLSPHTRVTLDVSALKSTEPYLSNAKLAQPTDPTRNLGYHWGYTTRLAPSLSSVITESPYPKGYDFVIGTSERGEELNPEKTAALQPFEHLLVVLGGQAGIEAAAENDSELKLGAGNVNELFDWWINCVVGQGSRTIRTEEAIWIVLGQMFGEFKRKGIK